MGIWALWGVSTNKCFHIHPWIHISALWQNFFRWLSRNVFDLECIFEDSVFSEGFLVAQLKIYMQCRRPGFDPWVRKIPWRRAWRPTPVFSPGESSWTEEPGGLQAMGSQRVRHDWATNTHTEQCLQVCSRNLGLRHESLGRKVSWWEVLLVWEMWRDIEELGGENCPQETDLSTQP